MTDFQRTKELFNDLGIGFAIEEPSKGTEYTTILLEVMGSWVPENNSKVKGYRGFNSEFRFDKEEKFIEVIIAE
jgi:hypothetical protein